MIYYRTKDYVMKAAVDKNGGIMVALQVPPEIANKLALEGGQPANDLHITLVYLGKDEEFGSAKKQTLHDIVSSIAKEYAPIDVTITGYGVFPETDDGPCLYAAVGLSDSLDSLQETVAEAVASYGMPPQGRGAMNGQYIPHITLAYGESAPPPGVAPVTEFKAEWLSSSFGATDGLFRLQGVRKSFLMKVAFDESQHPRAEDGKFSEGGGGEGARVFMTPDDVITESTWGGKKQYVIRDPKTGKGSGRLISAPVDRKDIPETLYHMTTNLPAVHSSGYLKAATDGGGMGGGNGMPGVSFTTSKADADLMAKEITRTMNVSREAPESFDAMKSRLEGFAREDEKNGLQRGDLQRAVDYSMHNWDANYKSSSREWNGEDWDSSPTKDPEKMKTSMQRLAKETFTQYLQARDMDAQKLLNTNGADFHQNDKYASLKDPLLYGSGEDFAKMDPARIGIITTSKKNLPGRALVRAGSDDFLHEIRVHADVPLDKVAKDGDAGSSLLGAQDGQATNLDTMNHDKRRKPIDGQVYTAFTPDGSLGTATSPGIMKRRKGIMKDGFGGGQGQGQGLTVATAPEYPKKKFTGAIAATFEDKDNNGDLKKNNLAIPVEPSPEMADETEDRDTRKAHDAGVQPEAHDEKPKYPAMAIAPGMAVLRAEGWNEADHPREPAGSAGGGRFSGGTTKTPTPANPNGIDFDKPFGKNGWAAVPADQKDMVRANWIKEWVAVKPDQPGRLDEARNKFDSDIDDAAKLNHFRRMDADEFVPPGEVSGIGNTPVNPAGERMVGPGALNDYNEWQHVPKKWQAVAQNQFEREWPDWAKNHGPEEFKNASTERLQEIARSRWNGLEDGSKLDYAQTKVPPQEFPELARRDFNATDPRFWGDEPGGLKPLAPGLPTDQLGKEPRVGMPGGGTTPNANEEADRIGDFLAGRGERPDDAVMQRWKDRGWIAQDATFEKGNPEPEAWDDDDTPTPAAPESWDELGGDKQERVKDAWINANRSEYVQGEIDNWRQDDYNFQDIPEELGKDEEWNRQAIKEIHDNYYPGEPVEGLNDLGGGTPAQHDEQERRIKEWNDKFDFEGSFNNGAFITDNETGKLEVNTDKLVFRDNPHEGSQQQTFEGVSQEELSNAFKKSQWAKVKDDYEEMYKEAFDKEAEQRVENAKENPPDYIGEGAEENLGELWSGMDSKEKFAQAARFLNTDELQAGEESPHANHVAGTVEPRKDDTKEQKAIQAKKVKSQKALNGGISTTKIVTMDDGSKYVWKPSTGEVAAGEIMPAGTQYAREVAANDLAHLVGMGDMVPNTAIIKHEGVWGAALFAIPNSHNDGTSGNDRFQEDARKASFFDYVIANVDRHDNNWMSDKDGKLWLIDHGRSFPEKKRHLGHTGLNFGIGNDESDPNGEPWDTQIPESIRKPWRDKYDKIVKIMERRGLGQGAIASLKTRYDKAMREKITWRELFSYESEN